MPHTERDKEPQSEAPAEQKRSRLEEMLDTVPDDYEKGEWDTGHTIGAEIFD
jgi:hypothetical protein